MVSITCSSRHGVPTNIVSDGITQEPVLVLLLCIGCIKTVVRIVIFVDVEDTEAAVSGGGVVAGGEYNRDVINLYDSGRVALFDT